MRSLLLSLLVALPGLPASVPAAADVTIVKGEVVHMACPVVAGLDARGDAHAACAMDCARKGEPMALMTNDAIYVIEGSYSADRNAKLLDFVARMVEAKGTISERGGTFYFNIAAMTVQKQSPASARGANSR